MSARRLAGHARLASVAIAPLLAACRDTTEPGAGAPATAFVNVSMLTASRADTVGTATISANVIPGRDERGALRDVTSPLLVGGRTVALGAPNDGQGTRFVQMVSVRLSTALGRQPLAVDAPTLTGVTANRPRVRTTTVRALDADTVRPDADGALRLHLAIAPGDDAATMRQWTLTVTGAQGIAYRGSGQPPAELAVPRDLLPAPTPAGQWQAHLDVQEGHGIVYGIPTAPVTIPPYDVRVTYQQVVRWTVIR